MRTSVVAPAAAIFLSAAGTVRASGEPEFRSLGDLPGGNTISLGLGISRDGSTVVGQSTSLNGQEAFRWRLSTGMVGLGDLPLGMFQSAAYGADNTGAVVVGVGRIGIFHPTEFIEGFRWVDPGPMLGVGQVVIGKTRSFATAVDGSGTRVAGWGASNSSGGTDSAVWTPPAGLMVVPDLPGGLAGGEAHDISFDGEWVVGSSFSTNAPGPGVFEAYRWRVGAAAAEPLGDLPGDIFLSDAQGVSDDGQIVVGYSISDQGLEAFRWTPGGMRGLGDLPMGAEASVAFACSGDGFIIVGRGTGELGDEAFIWDPVAGMRSLRTVLMGMGLNLTDWRLTSANAISRDGTVIAGTAVNPAGNPEAFRAVIPWICRVDFNRDTELDFTDIEVFIAHYTAGAIAADQNLDGEVDFSDIEQFLARYNAGCTPP